jgi:hypothetical protein
LLFGFQFPDRSFDVRLKRFVELLLLLIEVCHRPRFVVRRHIQRFEKSFRSFQLLAVHCELFAHLFDSARLSFQDGPVSLDVLYFGSHYTPESTLSIKSKADR